RFAGKVVPVNPQHDTILGRPAYPSIAASPEAVDLAVIATPAATVPEVMRECVAAGVKGAIVISAGFKETGPAGLELEAQVLAEARRGQVRVIGPNCLGVMRPQIGLNATFARPIAQPGNVAFLSQSGALCTAVLDWSQRENVGFSAFVSIGSMLDVGWGDLIDHFGDDPQTHGILLYMETIGDARAFLSAAREVALTKPIIVLKTGRTAGAARAAVSHTGSLAGSDAVLDAAFRRCGVLRVETIAELFYLAEALAKQDRPLGPRLTIVTNAGGPGVLATDALLRNGGQLATLQPQTIARLDALLPAHWSHTNPIDLLGDADAQRYAQVLEVVAADRDSDGVLVIVTPQAMTEPAAVADAITPYRKMQGRPLLSSWMGGPAIEAGEATLNRVGVPTFPYPDTAARIFTLMWRYSDQLRSLYETPLPLHGDETPRRAAVEAVIAAVRAGGRTVLTEVEAKQVLAAYDLPVVETRTATTADEAVAQAEALGYPVVLKLLSPTITHKSDVGGVKLNLPHAAAVRDAYAVIQAAGAAAFAGVTVQPMIAAEGYELILGSSIDPQLGPVLLFGAGGQLVEIWQDHTIGLPPLTSTLARRMIERTQIARAFNGVRGWPPIDRAALEQLLVRFSQLVMEQPRIKEIDINPLLAAPEQLLALDARIVLHEPEVADAQLPTSAIRPYPLQYVAPWTLKDGTPVTIRPIRPDDEPLMVAFHHTLSDRSVYLRYFAPLTLARRTDHQRLTRMCFIDYAREMALVVERSDPETGAHAIIGVGRLIRLPGRSTAEWAILVSDEYQRSGIGTELLGRLLEVARDERLAHVIAEILPENRGMLRVAEKLGFRLRRVFSENMVMAEIDL
ncbi:MAG TPA: bifunctional acetate--CoA ligase family protein/GNAT family N-acetyltransferase, partial [Herpetosiphonaceae bacterium]